MNKLEFTMPSKKELDYYSSILAVQTLVPGFKVKEKSKSLFQKFIGLILSAVGNKSYMKGFWSTFGYTAYAPDREHKDHDWIVILHEGQHAYDAKKLTRLVFGFLYLFPLSISVPAGIMSVIMSFVYDNNIFLLGGVAALIASLPWIPDPFRLHFERRAYTISMLCSIRAGFDVDIERYVDHLCGTEYYIMEPSRNKATRIAEEMLSEAKDLALNPDSAKNEYERMVLKFLKEREEYNV